MSLEESELRYSGDVVGNAEGRVEFDTSSSGATTDVLMYALATDGDGKEQMFTNNTVHWSANGAAGEGETFSVMRLLKNTDTSSSDEDALTWDVYGGFEYGSNKYWMTASDQSTSGDEWFYVTGNGGYGASSVLSWYVLSG